MFTTQQNTQQNDATTTALHVSGMTCSHCVAAVTAELSKLGGAESVDVDLVAGGVSLVTVASTGPLDPVAVAAAIDEAGYELVSESV
ncbi:copper chaperone [Cryobacterium sp. TmT2-59]|uniref:Copper chaperone n=1 Tax=Cryobacterium shii TaxID=1259235 RepID=A0AAQ2C8F1_9MICO|nr:MULTISPECIES: heavy-metal-associated domain-containing protein [Cryobacterium]TFC52202.1 copper chaperone [Cryobacterium shii]TFC84755.1 copper chaperone [Cryobacterium sp. TmT2-59]